VDEVAGNDPLLVVEADRGMVAENMRILLGGEATSVATDWVLPRRRHHPGWRKRRSCDTRAAPRSSARCTFPRKRAEEQIQRYVAQIETRS
jgi:hypothetical protein